MFEDRPFREKRLAVKSISLCIEAFLLHLRQSSGKRRRTAACCEAFGNATLHGSWTHFLRAAASLATTVQAAVTLQEEVLENAGNLTARWLDNPPMLDPYTMSQK